MTADVGGAALGEGTWPSDPARLAELARGTDGSGSTPSSCRRGATSRSCAWCRSWSASEVEVLDPLVDAFDPAPLAEVLADPEIEIVAARRPPGRRDPAPRVEDRRSRTSSTRRSRRASPASPRRRATTACCTTCCEIRLPKTASFTRWDARPLTDEQLRYARGDVEHLLPLADDIQQRAGRARTGSEWAREECVAIAEATDERDPDEVWRRLPRVSGLDPRERAVAQRAGRLARAHRRRRRTGPVGAVLRDPTVVELAKRQPDRPPRAGPDPRHQRRTSCAAAATT